MIDESSLRAALRDPPAADLEYLRQLRDAALAHVEKLTGKWYGAARDQAVTLEGKGSRTLWLPGPLLQGYEEVTVAERAYPGGDPRTILEDDSDGWEIRGSTLLRHGGAVWWSGWLYDVTYQQGATEASVPADVGRWIQETVAGWYEVRLPVGDAVSVVPTGAEAIMQTRRWLPI